MPHNSDAKINIPLLSRPGFLVSFMIVVVAAIVAAFWAGTKIHSPESTAIATASETVPITAKVEQRIVSDQISVSGSVQPGPTYAIISSPPEGPGRSVITSTELSIGDDVGVGELVATVSGQPLFLLDERVPLYRDLKVGDEGPDVFELQAALASMGYYVNQTSKVDLVTMKAVERIYDFFGQSFPKDGGEARIKFSHFAAIPGNRGTVTAVSPVGKILGPDDSVISIQTSENVVVARATLLEADRLTVGLPVSISGKAGHSVRGTVHRVGPFHEGATDSNTAPGKDVTIVVNDGRIQELQPMQAVTISTISTDLPDLAIPVVAIRQDATGEYVLLNQSGTDESTEIRIRTIAEQDGWAKIAGGSGLKAEDTVLIQ